MDIYENLDNYEDLNIIEKLKNENAELKNKLEEYATAMDKLQKDFDRVSSDFKKLEMNYSSLLKTAKVEIERKTKIIKDLNTEKDMMVLKVLQNKNIQDVRTLRSMTKPFIKGPVNDSNFCKKSNEASTDNLKAKSDTGLGVRKEDNRFSSVDTTTSCNTDIADRLLKLACNNTESGELWSDRTSDTKENMAKKDAEDSSSTKPRALSIRNRRKSMPAARSQTQFSSDEECEDPYSMNETFKKRFLSRDGNNRQNDDKVTKDRYRHKALEDRNKVSETSSLDDRYSGYEPNRDTYHRNRNEKYGIDKYRSRDRYDNTQRHKRYLSPERSRRPSRVDDFYQRQEFGRQRYLESPPPDKFHHYQQRNRESHSKHDRDNPFDFERRDRHQEKYPPKHKVVSDHYEGPVSKRQRTDSFNKNPEEKKWAVDKGVPMEKTVSDLFEEMPQYTSCQSPDDYLHSGASSPHPVKEIMSTASTPLEDPRSHSKKYILKTVDHTPALSTVVGRNVDLKMVDLSKWGINQLQQVAVPTPLTRRPSQGSEEIIKHVYMDIDNPVSNMSAESGEILSCLEDDLHESDSVNKLGQTHCRTERPDIKAQNNNCDKLNTEVPSKDSEKVQTSIKSYRIPKIKNSDQSRNPPKVISNKDGKKTSKLQLKIDPNSNSRTVKQKSNIVDKVNISNKEKNYLSSLKHEKKCKDSLAVSKEIIAGDLELSDETCDNVEIQGKLLLENTSSQMKPFKEDNTENVEENTSIHTKSCSKDKTKNPSSEIKGFKKDKAEINQNLPVHTKNTKGDKIETSENLSHISSKKDKPACKELDSIKNETSAQSMQTKSMPIVQNECKTKSKGKKKYVKVNDKVEKSLDNKGKVELDSEKMDKMELDLGKIDEVLLTSDKIEVEEAPDKKGKLKKDKKTKFNELFGGDSNSLITPDDLGITTVPAQQHSTMYIPICEDAQDAVDVNVTEAGKAHIHNLNILESDSIEGLSTHQIDNSESKPNNKTIFSCKSNTERSQKCESESDICVEEKSTNNECGKDLIPPITENLQISLPIVTKNQLTPTIEVDSKQEELVNNPKLCMNLIHKPEGLIKALATSTPHKVLLQDCSENEKLPVIVEPKSNQSNNETSVSNTTADQSSTADTLGPQNNDDVPDVRIFVKRRRRVLKKPL